MSNDPCPACGYVITHDEECPGCSREYLEDEIKTLRSKLDALRAAAEQHLKRNPRGDREWLLVRAIEESKS